MESLNVNTEELQKIHLYLNSCLSKVEDLKAELDNLGRFIFDVIKIIEHKEG